MISHKTIVIDGVKYELHEVGVGKPEESPKKIWGDEDTGLEWEYGTDEEMTWEDATKYAESLGEGWRLPEVKELLTLVDYSKSEPATSADFIGSYYYWSSSPCVFGVGPAWYVGFKWGNVNTADKSCKYRVRFVRGCL